MRLLLAGLFVYVATMATVISLSDHFGKQPWPWWASLATIVTPLAAMILSSYALNRRGFRPSFRRRTLEQRIADLESQGLLLRQPFQAVRGFEVEQLEDEGLHYYIELVDGRVLYLNGQYLYSYEAITDDAPSNRPRLFPCTEFEVLRHREAGYAFHIHCAGRTLEPELITPAFTRKGTQDRPPEDGAIISDQTYESLKAERAH